MKAWELYRSASGMRSFGNTVSRMRLKLRRLASGKIGFPGATLHRIIGQKTWMGQTRAARGLVRLQKHGRLRMHPEAMFFRQENLATGKGSSPTSLTAVKALSGWGEKVSSGPEE